MFTYFILKICIPSKGLLKKMCAITRRLIIDIFKDPAFVYEINGKKLLLPLSHNLPFYIKDHIFYDKLLTRISDYLHLKQQSISGIDVGANVGDTIMALYRNQKDIFLGVEPEPKFFEYLKKNTIEYKNILIDNTICSSQKSQEKFVFEEENGTARLIPSQNSEITPEVDSLDNVLEKYPQIDRLDILKIDTDGHDFDVMKGSQKTIKKYKPIILFECDSFSNNNYVKDVLQSIKKFLDVGYANCLIYDNFGYLIGRYNLSDTEGVKKLLWYQEISNFYYYDILVLPNKYTEEFYKQEIDYFVKNTDEKNLKIKKEDFL